MRANHLLLTFNLKTYITTIIVNLNTKAHQKYTALEHHFPVLLINI